MEKIKAAQKKYCSLAITFAIFTSIIFFLFGFRPIGKGLLLGTIFSIINFILIAETLPLRLGFSRKKATVISFFTILLRYGLLAVPLAASIKLEQFNLWATVCGLFMVQLVILADELIRQLYFSTEKKNCTEKLLWKN